MTLMISVSVKIDVFEKMRGVQSPGALRSHRRSTWFRFRPKALGLGVQALGFALTS